MLQRERCSVQFEEGQDGFFLFPKYFDALCGPVSVFNKYGGWGLDYLPPCIQRLRKGGFFLCSYPSGTSCYLVE